MVRNCTVIEESIAERQVVVDAIRCWRSATDGRRPVQPSLFAALAERGCEVLAPVFDSLLRITEEILGRPIAVGASRAWSADESLLLDLLASRTRLKACSGRSAGAVRAFGCALCSTRVMLKLTLPQAPRAALAG